jgi:hypothetical protein
MKPRMALLTTMIFGAAALRLLPHAPNFDPITALALFGGAQIEDRRWAFVLPLAAMLLSDLLIGFHPLMPVIYLTFALVVWMGISLRRRLTPLPVAGAALGAATLFFVVSNFAEWTLGMLYPRTVEGLIACYVAAIPFFGNTIGGALFYSVALFGGLVLAQKKFPQIASEARLAAR